MGSAQSSHATGTEQSSTNRQAVRGQESNTLTLMKGKDATAPHSSPKSVTSTKMNMTTKSLVSGRMPSEHLNLSDEAPVLVSSAEEDSLGYDSDTGTSFYDSDSDLDDEEEDEEFEERLAILADCYKLKLFADAYLHPEKPVVADETAMARNYFTRPSAIEAEEDEERAQILADAAALKKLAVDYLHPENPVVCEDSTARARNYFDRADAVTQEEQEAAEERAQVLREAVMLKKLAVDYLHPENPVVSSDATLMGRNYFNRASAVDQEEQEAAEERAQVLSDAVMLKKLAVDYLHPENPVVSSDSMGLNRARNYFNRASAPEQAELDERASVLADAAALEKLAVDYLHPEMPVVCTDATAFGRNYFTRPSAAQDEDAEERAQVLADAAALKKLAMDYMHPEAPVICTDATLMGRNYFTRASAAQDEDAEERAEILADAAALKKLAVDYLHPENPVICTDATLMGRNYFTRPSAAQDEDAEERAQVLADAAALKKLAMDYMHPEAPVVSTDATAFGRNYFSRTSAEQDDDAEERAEILADMAALKKFAVDYMHPEMPVVCTDASACGRNYFTRPSAEQDEDAEERAGVMADMAALKKLAVDYMHPEMPVICTDATATGRNYFDRFSAEQDEDAEERAQIMADTMALKKLAIDYMHPEIPVVCTDATATGRNYFDRFSAEQDEDAEERAQVLADVAALKKLAQDYMHPDLMVVCALGFASARNFFTRASAVVDHEYAGERAQALKDAAALKKLAVDYMHPENPVVCTDPTACGRNYFTRASAPQDDQDMDERAQVLADMAALKKLAVDYMHPENMVVCALGFASARNFFNRASAAVDHEYAQERAQALEDAAALKKLAQDYMHPELPVVCTDSTLMARNYFTRPSAVQDNDAEERAQVFADMESLKSLAVAYMHPEMPVVSTDATSFGRNYFTRPSAPQDEDAEERSQVLADMASLKSLAIAYMHPERPVVGTDSTAFGRNYFTRPSAAQDDEADERAEVLADMASLKHLAVDYMHPELPVVSSDSTACARNYFDRPSAVQDQDADERAQALADVSALKRLAVDYMHPEKSVVCTDAAACGRSYFSRPSAPQQLQEEEMGEREQVLADTAALKSLAMDYFHPERPVVLEDASLMGRNYFTRPSAPQVEDAEEREQVLKEAAMLKKLAVDYMHPELPVVCTDACAGARTYFERFSAPEVEHPVEAAQAAHKHAAKAHFEEEVMEETIRSTITKFQRSHSFGQDVAVQNAPRMITKEEEGHLSRSPSSVMLFDMGGVH